MNKAAIKNFAIWARNKLIDDVRYKARLIGITEHGIAEPMPNSVKDLQFFDIGNDNEPYAISGEAIEQRKKLIAALKKREKQSDYKTAFDSMLEETAYTWFNRLIAIRFMEVNQYLPSGLRVLSSGGDKLEPELVSKPFDSGFKFSDTEKARVLKWKDNNNAAELFAFLFIRQCNELNAILPELFEKINDYTELLINLNYTDPAGAVHRLITDIPEDDFKEAVEIIGWLYQYYNTELNELVYDRSLARSPIPKELLPAATTIYTPDWPIRYMVENSLGCLWIEGHPNEELKKNWKYYLDEVEQEEDVKKQLEEIRQEYKTIKPERIKVIDPCMGSGHILVYMFTVLMQIYESQGYNPRDAAKLILEKNLYGLDIDDRAWQLAYFAVLMKARQYNRSILTENIKPHLYAVQESNGIDSKYLQYFGDGMDDKERNVAFQDIKTLIAIFNDGKEYGSILKIPDLNFILMHTFIEKVDKKGFLPVSTELFPETEKQPDLMELEKSYIDEIQTRLNELIDIAEILHGKYQVIVTNPPYLGSSRFSSKLSFYVKNNFQDVKSDLSMVLHKYALQELSQKYGFISFITTSSWMFLSSFEKIRDIIINNFSFDSIVDYGTELFDGKVGHNPIVSWVIRNCRINYTFRAIRLVDYCYSRRDEKENEYFNEKNCYIANNNKLSIIPGIPLAYWVSDYFAKLYNNSIFTDFYKFKRGIATGNNDLFLRLWWEVNIYRISLSQGIKWYPYNKGGEYRKWYGNREYIINWENNGRSIKGFFNSNGKLASRPQNIDSNFVENISYSSLTSGKLSFRRYIGFINDQAGNYFIKKGNYSYNFGLALLNSPITEFCINMMNGTLNTTENDFNGIPLPKINSFDVIEKLVINCENLSRTDWDSFETSWDFKRHPLIPNANLCETPCPPRLCEDSSLKISSCEISKLYSQWQQACEERFQTLKSNEEELNRIFIEIYGLQDELTPEVEDKDVTVRKADLGREIRSLISYAVGCMFGRYSLDTEGLAYAGGEWDNSKYKTFIPDKNNIIPITDEDYANDDIANRFIDFINVVYGEETLEENLNFIAGAINNRGGNSRDTIRGYFLNDFYKDHVKIYQKRPIYWLFDSGKENGFKALIYMHRYHADTIGNLRIEYLHKMQNTYESEIARMQRILVSGSSGTEKAKSQKRLEKLQRQLRETNAYDVRINHLALSRIEIDLDDGVKLNYEKVQTAQDGKKLEVLGKIG